MQNKRNIYAAVLVLLAFIYNILIYNGGRFLSLNRIPVNMTLPFEEAIPLIPWMSFIYLGCYAFWGLTYYLVVRNGDEKARTLLAAHFIGEGIGLLFFILLPTTMVRPVPEGDTIAKQVLLFIYQMDAPDQLFPSFHCFVSWMCWIGVRRNAKIPGWYRYFSLGMAILISITVLTVKQHVVADVISGMLLAEASFGIAKIFVHRRHEEKKR